MSSIPLDALGSSQTLRNHPPLLEHEIEDAYAGRGPSEDEPISTSAATKAPPWKRELYALLEHPTSSPSAFVIHVFTTALIIISALVTMLETVPAFHEISVGTWFGLETSLVALFTVEYVARCFAWSLSWKTFFQWAGSFFGIIDLLAILPYYIEIALHQDTSTLFRFSILRTFRLLRVFRAFRYNNILLLTIEVMYLSFRRSQHALLALSFFVAMVLIVFSTLLHFIERGTWDDTLGVFINSDGDPSQFASIPAAGWFVLVTITTVGYGEITPRSFLGRLITLPLLIFGLLLIALPSFVLGREFSIVWNEMISQEESPERNDHRSPMLTPASPTLSRNGPSQFSTQRSVSRGRRSLEVPNGDRAQTPPTQNLDQRQASEMSQQIAELRSIIERQGEMLRQLLERDAYARRDS